MSSRWLLALLLVPLLSSIAFSQKLINGFTREFAIQGLPAGFSLKSFDVTGDSVSDLFVSTSSQLLVFDGKTFSMIFKDSVAPGTNNLSPADVNRDGSIDLVATSSDTAIVVWYGPDFLTQRVFHTDSGFKSFAVRNREDGQVEFSFGFTHIHSSCIPTPVGCDTYIVREGHILRFVDTTFNFSDSIHVGLNPTFLSWNLASTGRSDLFLFGFYWRTVYGPGPIDDVNLRVERMNGLQISPLMDYSASYNWEIYCPLMIVLRTYSIGNIDVDTANEIVAFADPAFISGFTCTKTVSFAVYDVLSGQQQWARTDLLGIISLFTVDLNGDGIQELLSYEIQNAIPGLAEYQTSDGTTLGFTQLPFIPSTLLPGLFGNPREPKVLLGDKDSLVVYGIDVPTDVREVKGKAPLPSLPTLWPAVPNPFNSQMSISYSLPVSGFVNLEIMDILGRKVKSLVSTNQRAGQYQATWDGTDNLEKIVGSGVYLAVLKANGVVTSQKIVFLK